MAAEQHSNPASAREAKACMSTTPDEILTQVIQRNVEWTLSEDIGSGDITAQLIPAEKGAMGRVITRERAVIA
ncbi:MAG: hypothetical protein ACPGYX_03895, partial [Oceanobacter sp.]